MDKREMYIEDMKKQLDEWNTQLDHFENSIDEASETVKHEYQKNLANLQEYRDTIREGIKTIENSSEEAWQAAKQGISEATDRLEEGIKESLAELA